MASVQQLPFSFNVLTLDRWCHMGLKYHIATTSLQFYCFQLYFLFFYLMGVLRMFEWLTSKIVKYMKSYQRFNFSSTLWNLRIWKEKGEIMYLYAEDFDLSSLLCFTHSISLRWKTYLWEQSFNDCLESSFLTNVCTWKENMAPKLFQY